MLYFHLAEAYLANGETAEAKVAFEKAKSLKAEDFHPLERQSFKRVAKNAERPLREFFEKFAKIGKQRL